VIDHLQIVRQDLGVHPLMHLLTLQIEPTAMPSVALSKVCCLRLSDSLISSAVSENLIEQLNFNQLCPFAAYQIPVLGGQFSAFHQIQGD